MKRSRSIRLVLIGSMSAGALTGCGPSGSQPTPVSTSAVYTNNYYLPGVGYYHAPFRAWHALPYNYYDPQRRQYFQGGRWAATPHESITNISSPTVEAARQAAAQPASVPRGGFGGTAQSHFINS